jgi:hypothetical protein
VIYLITARSVGRVKIGRTDQAPHSRYIWLRAWSPVPLALEAVMEGGLAEEAEMHRRFAEQRRHGEWFEITPEIDELIAANRYAPPQPAAAFPDVERVVGHFGSASELARRLGVPMTTVATWRQRGRIPAWRLEAVSALMEAQS